MGTDFRAWLERSKAADTPPDAALREAFSESFRREAAVMAAETENVTAGKPGDRQRWAFLAGLDIGADGDPYLDRLRIFQTPWAGLYLHHIHRPDADRDPHDHPWAFASVVLCGGYTEDTWPDKTRGDRWTTRKRGRFSAARTGRKAAHIITSVDGPLWTLVATGPRRAGWGFWVQGPDGRSALVPWREYISAPGRGAV